MSLSEMRGSCWGGSNTNSSSICVKLFRTGTPFTSWWTWCPEEIFGITYAESINSLKSKLVFLQHAFSWVFSLCIPRRLSTGTSNLKILFSTQKVFSFLWKAIFIWLTWASPRSSGRRIPLTRVGLQATWRLKSWPNRITALKSIIMPWGSSSLNSWWGKGLTLEEIAGRSKNKSWQGRQSSKRVKFLKDGRSRQQISWINWFKEGLKQDWAGVVLNN